jgi:hypothetical protein
MFNVPSERRVDGFLKGMVLEGKTFRKWSYSGKVNKPG